MNTLFFNRLIKIDTLNTLFNKEFNIELNKATEKPIPH